MRALIAIAICLSALPLGATPVEAKSQREKAALQFDALWDQRLSEYRQVSTKAASEHKAAAESIQASPPFNFGPNDARLGRFMEASEANARIGGKGGELDAFLRHMRTRPSPGLTRAYLQERVQKMEDATNEAERVRIAFTALIRSEGHSVHTVLTELQRTAMTRGDVIGRSAELELVIANWGAYADDYAAASQRDRESRARWAAALGAFGQSMAANRTWTASCIRTGNMVNCSGQ